MRYQPDAKIQCDVVGLALDGKIAVYTLTLTPHQSLLLNYSGNRVVRLGVSI